jgi:hypothetical protein
MSITIKGRQFLLIQKGDNFACILKGGYCMSWLTIFVNLHGDGLKFVNKIEHITKWYPCYMYYNWSYVQVLLLCYAIGS